MFADLLSRLSRSEARTLDYACRHSAKGLTANGLIIANDFLLDLAQLRSVAGVTDLLRLDRELDDLRSLELLHPCAGSATGGPGRNEGRRPAPPRFLDEGSAHSNLTTMFP